MHTGNCFDVSTYERMLAGQLPAAEAETVCEHLEACDRCFQVVRGLPEDTLAASIRQEKWPASAVGTTFIRDLAQKVLKQAESRGQPSPGVIMFSCSSCGNKLKVKPELAGKKVKCPKCAQGVLVPASEGDSSAGTNPPEEKTRAPQDVGEVDAPTLPPANTRTIAPVSKEDTNLANQAAAAHAAEEDRGLFDFLAPPEQADEIGRLGSYRVLKVLGAGGMGVVFKAEDPGLQRLVAVKAMLPAVAASASAKQRFLREARAAAAIKHIHIVTIFQVGEDRGVPFLAMEFLKGEPLDERLKRETILPLAETLRIGREMAEGMTAAHEEGLIHRDIKPANTWLEGKKGHVKILDFGLARSTADQAHLTQSGAIIGTPAYMSPEQGRSGKLDARCDLWSLGVMLYRMCTGELPFKGDDTVGTLMEVAMTNPPPPAKVNRAVPAGLSKLVMKLLEKDPAKRTASAGEVVEALRALEQTQQVTQVVAGAGATSVGQKLKSVGQKLFSAGKTIDKNPAPDPIPKPSDRAASVSDRSANDRSKNRKPVLLALAGGLVAAIALGIIIFWPTPDGVIRIESDDPAVEVVFDKDGPTIKGADKELIRLKPGEHGVLIQRGDFQFKADNFEMRKGDKITLKIEFLQGKMQFLRDEKVISEKTFPPQLAKNDPAKKEDAPKEKPPPFVPLNLAEKEAKKLQEDTAAKLKLPVEATNKIGMKMMLIPPAGAALPAAYYLGKYEVTQGQWQQVMGYNPSNFGPQNAKLADTSKFPVEQVGWYDCVEYCNKLSEMEGLKPYYQLTVTKRPGKQIEAAEVKILGGSGYHIPTEAEWEHGCRAGTKTLYHFGDQDADLPDYGWFQQNSQNRTHGVGEKKPNAFGLFDMHGNVWEWCEDQFNPGGPARVIRGGCWYSDADLCRAASRNWYAPSYRSLTLGFRLARVPSAGK